MSKHTPGKWRIKEGLQDGVIIAEDGKAIVNGDGFAILERGNNENFANARLIVAAPELLEACKCAFYNIDWLSPKEDEVWKALKQAIAKAKGKKQ